ncbi:hypothetical protein U8V97_06405 [Priestia filamentosa]|uniref:hypothetical protein n=1 Tax=Priestia filamentosa TaxID=1402861 RepID=UPI00397BE4EC
MITINKYMTLGICKDNIHNITKDLQSILNVHFEEHESSYWGEYNVAILSEKENIRITYNYVDEDWQEEDFKQYPLLLKLNRVKEPEKIMNLLCSKLSYVTPLYLEEIEARVGRRKYYDSDKQDEL